MENKKGKSPEDDGFSITVKNPGELFSFVREHTMHLQISLEEAEVAMGYLEGHGYTVGYKGEEIVCCDHSGKEDAGWKAYSVDDLINDAYNFNDEMIRQTIEGLEKADDDQTYDKLNAQLDQLRKDEEILDKAYDRTKYGIELEKLARQMAEQIIVTVQSATRIEDIDQEIKRLLGEDGAVSLYSMVKEKNEKGHKHGR